MSERYEGLNLPQLLDLMHEIVMPDPVSRMPETDGWWVVLAWAVVATLLCGSKYLEHRRRNRYRREALSELDHIDTKSPSAAADVASIVKRTALVAYARDDVAALYGADWAQFLIQSASNDSRVRKGAGRIAEAAYKPGIEAKKLIKPAQRWVKVHRA